MVSSPLHHDIIFSTTKSYFVDWHSEYCHMVDGHRATVLAMEKNQEELSAKNCPENILENWGLLL